MFLIRAAFWLSIVILFIPAERDESQPTDVKLVSSGEALVAAQTVWSDLSGFCERNAEVCETGGTAMQTFSLKAKTGARMLYDFLDGDGATNGGAVRPATLQTADDAEALPAQPVLTSTIYATDKRS